MTEVNGIVFSHHQSFVPLNRFPMINKLSSLHDSRHAYHEQKISSQRNRYRLGTQRLILLDSLRVSRTEIHHQVFLYLLFAHFVSLVQLVLLTVFDLQIELLVLILN